MNRIDKIFAIERDFNVRERTFQNASDCGRVERRVHDHRSTVDSKNQISP